MISLRTECGIMLASLILSFCLTGCSAWSPGNPTTPEPSAGTALTPKPAGSDSEGNINPAEQVERHDPLLERH